MSKRERSTHGSIELEGSCSICLKGDAIKFFKCGSSKSLCCARCMERWIYAQTVEVKGTAHQAKCFNQCGALMDFEDLRELLSKESFEKYCADLTRVMLNGEKNTVWCPCETVFQTECGKSLIPYWHRCQGCKNYVCLGCGEFSKVPSSKRKRKAATTKRREHKKRGRCDESKHGLSMRCPRCRAEIHKSQGCTSMRCTMCDQDFLWRPY